MPVRVRFAPSPTGGLHIGGVRTALYNYLFAQQHQGVFILRIEDTDQTRYVAEAENYIIESLKWLGIEPTEGQFYGGNYAPYRQSERKLIYQEYIDQLIKTGKAYYAFDTPEELAQLRRDAEAQKEVFSYGVNNRNKLKNSLALSAEVVEKKLQNAEKYVIRFKIPAGQQLILHDIIRGEIIIDTNTLDDKVLFKSDGLPTYHFANIVDDHLMEITHVIRGEEWLPSMPLHYLLYQSFEWKAPDFAHLPLILKPSGKGKLSKRDGIEGGFPIFPLQWQEVAGYKETGYLPQAVINFLALLGWNSGTEQEIFSLEELIANFDLAKVNKSGARFNIEKAQWFNHQYLQKIPTSTLLTVYKTQIPSSNTYTDLELLQILDLIKERAFFEKDLYALSDYFFIRPDDYSETALNKIQIPDVKTLLQAVYDFLKQEEIFDAKLLTQNLKNWIQTMAYPMGKIMPIIRTALVGDLKGVDLMIIMQYIGKEESLLRLQNLITCLINQPIIGAK